MKIFATVFSLLGVKLLFSDHVSLMKIILTGAIAASIEASFDDQLFGTARELVINRCDTQVENAVLLAACNVLRQFT